MIKKFVHKKRFKAAFMRTLKDRDKRRETAEALKSRDFCKKQKLAAKVLSPIIRSMRLSDTRLQGKAGLLLPQLRRVQRSVAERLQKASEKVMPGEALVTAQAVRAVKARIEQRISELASDGVKAACMVHPHNLKELREEQDPEGRMHKVMLESRCAFYKVARVHPQWAAVQNQAVEYMNQKGIWLNGELLNKHERLTLEAFWDDVAAHCNSHALKEFVFIYFFYPPQKIYRARSLCWISCPQSWTQQMQSDYGVCFRLLTPKVLKIRNFEY